MDYYLVDKFNRGYTKEDTTVGSGEGFEFDGAGWNAKRRKISNIEGGEEPYDAVNNFELVKYVAPLLRRLNALESVFTSRDHYMSLNNKRRIVSVRPGKDARDVVVKSQLDEVDKKAGGILAGLQVTDKTIDIKGGRRLTNVGPGVYTNDVVTHEQLNEVKQSIRDLQTAVNQQFASLNKNG